MVLPWALSEIVDDALDLNGRWRGNYGPHGDEVVRIEHTKEQVLARKETGDAHVPAGQITFRANLEGWGGPGEGQIADQGFANARFVPGFIVIQGRDRIAFEWTGIGRVTFRRIGK